MSVSASIVSGFILFIMLVVSVSVLGWEIYNIKKNEIDPLKDSVARVATESKQNFDTSVDAINTAKNDIIEHIKKQIASVNTRQSTESMQRRLGDTKFQGLLEDEQEKRRLAIDDIQNKLTEQQKVLLRQDRFLEELIQAFIVGSSELSAAFNEYTDGVNKRFVEMEKQDITFNSRLNAMGTNIVTNNIQSKTIATDNLNSKSGFSVIGDNPGPLVQKQYGAIGDRYGVGQFLGGTTRVYTSGMYSPSSIALGFANNDNTFTDVLSIKNSDKNAHFNGNIIANKGIQINEKNSILKAQGNGAYNSITQSGDLVLTNHSTDLKGSMQNLNGITLAPWNGGGGMRVHGAGVNVKGTTSVSGALNVGPQGSSDQTLTGLNIQNRNNSWTHFDWKGDGKNYIRGDTVLNGKLQLEGEANVNAKLQAQNTRTNSIGHSTMPINKDWDNDGNWFRIYGARNEGTAVYNGMSINDGGGLAVGRWKKANAGDIFATGTVSANRLCVGNVCVNESQLKSIVK